MKNDNEIEKYIEEFEHEHFHGQSLPDDIQKLIFYKLKNNGARVFKQVDVQLRELGDTHSLISHDYLNERARGNIDTMANVQAMNEISENMGVVAYGESDPEGVIGYWPMDSEDRVLFALDTEGQYSLCLGETFLETVYFETVVSDFDEGKAECIKIFIELNIPFQADISADDIWKKVELRESALKHHPQKHREIRYQLILSEPEKIIGYTPESLKVKKTNNMKKPKNSFLKFWKR